ncbi:MAG: bifunctional 23S rRNA (guanine(2069)-N(7))-methyltransferase RlmK/23S rRNA (guanine(2445)-N(2))-methyltransferase RlmL [Planctomycetota bacterium]|nr:bifunctional 23S rRNA (guanine(2069)-N(7))-methyltransferase RlmK/23S rRNA (guanine(2445)-N(2))-methyltransferase RlmL [Planctomycetota bacterium]
MLNLIATTAFGLEAVVRRELAALGYDGEIIAPGWIRFGGDELAVCRANLWLRAADRVLVQVDTFAADDFEALFENTKLAAWHEWIPADGAFPVNGRSIKSQLSSVPACQRAVKKAVVESLLAAHLTDTLPETGPQYKIEVAILKNQVSLTIDTTGQSLHKRGYRTSAAAAPLKETLAAAMVMLSFWNSDRPLIDPFCGSGTIPIEAALIGRNIAPGIARTFAAEDWPAVAADRWRQARAEALDLALPEFSERLVGTDNDERALSAARRNAERAGVSDQVHFQQKSFSELSSQRNHGCVITNPPYGKRIGEQRELESLYHSIPEVLRKLSTWSHFILTAYPNFEGVIERQADRRRKLYNGRIECTYFQFHGPKQGEAAEPSNAAAVFGGLSEKAREQADLFGRRLQKRARHLRRWPTKQGITCYRLYERDVPEIPLIVDRYEDHLHITEYDRPHDRDAGQHADWLDLMTRRAAEVLDVDHRKVFLKCRRRQRGPSQHEQLADRRYEVTVQEAGLRFIVNLSDYVDTGLFLDHRITRSMVREAAEGATFLNLFGYTGVFTVYAAAGGAARTTTVDWSNTYLDWSKRNLCLNEFESERHSFVRADAASYLQQLPRHETYDLAVVDPPTFSNRKGVDDHWDVQRDHVELLNELMLRMKPGGQIYFSTNFRRFKLDEAAIQSASILEISRQTVPSDFRNRRVHRCWRLRRET